MQTFDDQYRSIVSCRSFIVSSRHPEETQKLARIQVSAFRQVLASTIGAEVGHGIVNLDMTEHDLHVAQVDQTALTRVWLDTTTTGPLGT